MTNETREEQKEEAAKSTEVEVKSQGGEIEEAGDEKRSLWDFEREFERAFENFFARDWLRSPRWDRAGYVSVNSASTWQWHGWVGPRPRVERTESDPARPPVVLPHGGLPPHFVICWIPGRRRLMS